MFGHDQVGRHLIEAHCLNARRFILTSFDHVVLNAVIDFIIGDHGWRHPRRLEGARPDRRALHAHFQPAQFRHIGDALIGEDIAHATAGIADQHHLGAAFHLIRDGREKVLIEHLVPMLQVTEQEGRIHNRRRAAEGGHMRWRDNAVIHRTAARRHIFEILLLKPQATVFVQHEIHRAGSIVALHQFFKAHQGAGEDVIIIELTRAIQGNGLLCARHRRRGKARRSQGCPKQLPTIHDVSPVFIPASDTGWGKV